MRRTKDTKAWDGGVRVDAWHRAHVAHIHFDGGPEGRANSEYSTWARAARLLSGPAVRCQLFHLVALRGMASESGRGGGPARSGKIIERSCSLE